MFSPSILSSPPDHFNFANDVVDAWAHEKPDLLAMHWINDGGSESAKLTYAYFSKQSQKAAQLLFNLGARRGDRVMIVLNRVPAWWEIATAVIRAGMVLCPCTTLATAKDIEYRLQTSNASIFIGNEATLGNFTKVQSQCPNVRIVLQGAGKPLPGITQYRDEVEKTKRTTRAAIRTTSSDPAIIYFTSGTTGPPKMVLHNQLYPLAHSLTATHWLRLDQGKLYWTLAEQGWAKAAWSWFSAWNAGATLFIEDSTRAFSPSTMLDVLHLYPITTLCAPPTAYRQLVTTQMRSYYASNPPKALERCVGAGEPLNPEVVKVWHSMSGIEIRDGYGQTETILVAANCGDEEVRRGSMGRAVPGVPLHIIDEGGRIVKDHTEGDIAIRMVNEQGKRSPFVYDGYIWKDGNLSRKSRPFIDASGHVRGEWHLTGDRAYQDRDGYLWFVGRSDDVINSSGYRIGPFEIESTLKLHPAVVESAVVGVPDPERGEVVKAFVVLSEAYHGRSDSALTKELQEHCKREAAPYKYPRRIQFVPSEWLPKTISGKIMRAEIRKREKASSRL